MDLSTRPRNVILALRTTLNRPIQPSPCLLDSAPSLCSTLGWLKAKPGAILRSELIICFIYYKGVNLYYKIIKYKLLFIYFIISLIYFLYYFYININI
jgi:hypothetical protein